MAIAAGQERNLMKLLSRFLMLTICITGSGWFHGPPPLHAVGAAVDHHMFADLLQKFVDDGVVDYRGFKKEEARLDRYLEYLAGIQPDTLNDKERFAFFANAYNAWTLKLILEHYPGIRSIKDAGSLWRSPWKQKIARIDGRLLTLDEIEHDILRAQFGDPRVHFAVNCASKGCPPLWREPFSGQTLDRQLDQATRAFINDPARYRLDGNTLYVSRIFKWFAEDFNDDPIEFFQQYAENGLRKELERRAKDLRVKYLDYDWSLNGV